MSFQLLPVANHLWQSTLTASAAGLLAVALRKNRAAVRYWLWLAASLKFLIPLSLLVALCSHLDWRTAPDAPPPVFSGMLEKVSEPFAGPAGPPAHSVVPAAPVLPAILLTIWACGSLVVLSKWLYEWRRVRSAVHAGTPVELAAPVPVVSSSGRFEPGIFGVFHPVLLLPAGIFDRLTSEQVDAIVAHESCHVRRRDNLAAALHMLVEAIFWFWPVVWWIRTRLIEERERACDAEVLGLGSSPRVYAESILKVCESYLASPAACVAGVSGASLKRRIEGIMRNEAGRQLSFARKLMLSGAALAAMIGPMLMGLNTASLLRAQSPAAFEVASVKPHPAGDRNLTPPQFLAGGRFVTRAPLLIVIAFAWDVPYQGTQLSHGPDWIRMPEGVYDIEARAEANALKGLSPDEQTAKLRVMLQTLLIDRFQLKINKESKEQPAYLVTVGKNGPKLQASKLTLKDCDDPASPCHRGGGGQGQGIHAKAYSMADLVVQVSSFTDHPLLNRTGLTGLYDIDTEGWVPLRPRPLRPALTDAQKAEDAAFADPGRATLAQIFEHLGLKMELSRAVVDEYVIVSVEKPAGN